MRDTPFSDHRSRFFAGKLGMRVFMVSLGMLFAASLIGLLVIRIELSRKGVWPDDLPALPRPLWLSTLVLIISSVTMQWALASIRRDRIDHLRLALPITFSLGIGFLVIQGICWLSWLEPLKQRWDDSTEFRFALAGFYMLTGLHALHVIGGLIPMNVVTVRAMAGAYSAMHHSGVHYCAMYWHFLDVVWIVLFISLMLAA